jgi:hypothetical protein
MARPEPVHAEDVRPVADAFRTIKKTFDPHGISTSKIVDAPCLRTTPLFA